MNRIARLQLAAARDSKPGIWTLPLNFPKNKIEERGGYQILGRFSKYVTDGYKKQDMWYSKLGKNLFLDISSTSIWYTVSSLYQCVETRSIAVFWLLSQPLLHLVRHHLRLSNVLERISRRSCEPHYAINTSHSKQETFLYEYHFIESFCLQKKSTIKRCSLVVHFSSTVSILITATSLWTCACASATKTVMKLDCAAT
jgi:hypothetical protein